MNTQDEHDERCNENVHSRIQTMTNYFYTDINGQKQGPVTAEELKQFAQQGTITPETIVENETDKSVPVKQCKGLTFPDTVQSDSTQSEPETIPAEPESEALHQDIPEQSDILGGSVVEETTVPETAPDAAEYPLAELKPTLETLEGKLDSLVEKFDILVGNIDFGTKFAEKKQEQIDKLYEENQEYKQGILDKFKKSLVLAVIGQIDAALKTISHFGNQAFSEENYRKLLENYNEIATDFQDSLAQSFDVVAFSSEENSPFDAKRQRSLKTVSTEDETKHKTISKSLRQGYEIENADGTKMLLRLEMVEVYVHQSEMTN